jgi:hypothetical protein
MNLQKQVFDPNVFLLLFRLPAALVSQILRSPGATYLIFVSGKKIRRNKPGLQNPNNTWSKRTHA